MPYKNSNWDLDVPNWFIELTGKQMDAMSFKLEVGEYPKVKINVSIKRLCEELMEHELKKLIEYCEKRLKCLT